MQGRENIPPTGGAVIAANHASYLDPPAVGVAMPRKLNFMAKADLFQIPILGHVIRALGAFPVRPASGDKAALNHGLKLLADGQLMGIFPRKAASNQELALRGVKWPQKPGTTTPVAVIVVTRQGVDRKFPKRISCDW